VDRVSRDDLNAKYGGAHRSMIRNLSATHTLTQEEISSATAASVLQQVTSPATQGSEFSVFRN
jgi:hypothetical protein